MLIGIFRFDKGKNFTFVFKYSGMWEWLVAALKATKSLQKQIHGTKSIISVSILLKRNVLF